MALSRQRIPDSPPALAALDPGVSRPLWSVMIPVYNCSEYLQQTLESVLSQDQGDDCMQIEVVDDASTDADVGALVACIGKGRISYFRQRENVGSLRNFQTCLDRSRGRLIHLLHGDDLVRSGFYEKMSSFFEKYPRAGAAFCRYAYINEEGRTLYYQDPEMENEGMLVDWPERLAERQRIQYAAMVVRREVYETLGGFYGVEYGEDWEMWMRIAAHYDTGYLPQVLAAYRKHASSISGRAFKTAGNMASIEWAMKRIQNHLPEDRRAVVQERSRTFYAHYALRVANTLWSNSKDKRAAAAQAQAAWNMSKDMGLLYKIVKLYTKITLNI